MLAEPLTQFSDFVEQQGAGGYLVFGIAFALWATCGLPVTPLEILSGFLFGVERAIPLVTAAKLSGCVMGFSISRHFFAATVKRWLERSSRLRLIQSLAAELESHPFRTVCMLRLVPLPLAVKNYALGALSKCDLTTFTAATLAVNLPMSVFWTVTGSRANSLFDALSGAGGGSAWALVATYGMSCAASSFVVARLTRFSHQKSE